MAYTVRSSEKLKGSGAVGETKALLYLMNFRDDSDEIHYFVVDFFNDLTGMDRYSQKLWDIQAKYAKNNSPNAIGKELVTLFKNYISDIDFAHFILFIGGVTGTLRVDASQNVFGLDNVKVEAKAKIIASLMQEAHDKTYIDNAKITNENIDGFLAKVVFVVDDKRPQDYVRAIIKNHPSITPDDSTLLAIFNEIRDKQSEKKNTCVEGVTIQTTDEVINFCRHLTNSEIRLLTLQRIINRNPVEKGIPAPFLHIYSAWPPEKRKEQIDECKQALCRALFNKNAADAFWRLFEEIYNHIMRNPEKGIQFIYQAISDDVKMATPDLDTLSLKYFIAVVKDGIQNED